jgi:hypothetical protein
MDADRKRDREVLEKIKGLYGSTKADAENVQQWVGRERKETQQQHNYTIVNTRFRESVKVRIGHVCGQEDRRRARA